MKLADYLDHHKLSQSEFARLAGLDRAVINKVVLGIRPRFSVPAAQAVVKATKGVVTLEECLGLTAKRVASR